MPPGELRLTGEHFNSIIDHVLSGAPAEVCGLLGGIGRETKEVFPVPNIAPDPATSFLMEPQTQINVLLLLEKRCWDLIAIYHSHRPGARTDLSPTDVVQAALYPNTLQMIIVPNSDGKIASLRAFSIEGERITEIPITLHTPTQASATTTCSA